MTGVEVTATIIRSLGFVALYTILGFGPGFILGIMLANFVFARGKPTIKETYNEAIKKAAQHNAQWDPSHERWKE